MGFARQWTTIAVLRAFLGGFEACSKSEPLCKVWFITHKVLVLPGAVFVIAA